jgi:hypothetical protein
MRRTAASGKSADVVCRRDGEVIMACEVKDRDLNIEMLHGTITNARLERVGELFALIRGKDAIARTGDEQAHRP